MLKRILVVGLGRLGEALAKTLAEEGAEVIALDNNLANLERVKKFVSLAVQGDGSDPLVLKQLGAERVDVAVVCMGEFFESNVLTTANLLELRIPYVASRASTALNAEVLKKIGTHEVFYVENEMGKIMGRRLTRPSIVNEMELGFGLKIIEWNPSEWALNKSLAELALPKNFQVQVIALRHIDKPEDIILPRPETKINPGMRCLLLGTEDHLQSLLKKT